MNLAFLLPLLTEFGAPMLKKILTGKIGAGNAELIGMVAERIADRAGVPVGELADHVAAQPEMFGEAIQETEVTAPELIAIWAKEIELRQAMFEAEDRRGGWVANWRPAGMYLIGFLLLWQIVVLHVLNAAFKIALPPVPWDVLFKITGSYMALYMGGHTLKDFASKKWGSGQ